jgi:hypothetical protein
MARSEASEELEQEQSDIPVIQTPAVFLHVLRQISVLEQV